MFSSKILRYFVLVSVTLFLLSTPFTIQAADQAGNADSTVYLPAVYQPGSSVGTLTNGGTYEGEGGVGLGALANSLAAPVDVSIVQIAAPTQTLPSQAQLLSDYYQVKATTVVSLTTESPLILAFPVPVGANTANLALAVLQNSAMLTDSDVSIPFWTLLEGQYAPSKGLFLTTLSSLDHTGETIALVDDPEFDSPPNTTAQAQSSISGTGISQFIVKCVNFTNTSDCNTTTETQVAGYLSDIYARITKDLSFHAPRLRFLDETLNYNPNSLSVLGYTTYIEPYNESSSVGFCGSEQAAGYYDPGQGRLVLCLNPANGLDPYYIHVLIHEYFHATQYGYNPVYTEYLVSLDERWVIEGMAKSAEESYFSTEMLRSTLGGWEHLHRVDMSLKSLFNLDEYDTQDFWVYYGQHTHQGLAYLDHVLTGGVQAGDIVKTIGDKGYLDSYFKWAKNQVMEAQINFGGALTTPCELELPVLNSTEKFYFTWDFKPYYDVTLPALTSAVVEVHWDYKYDVAYGQVFAPIGQPPEAKQAVGYKFYSQDDGTNCSSVLDGDRAYDHPDPGKSYYVVISNNDPYKIYTYRVGFEVMPVPPAR